MIPTNAPCDPKTHEAARRIAQRYVEMIAGLLRDEEKGEAMREAYLIAREVMETMEDK